MFGVTENDRPGHKCTVRWAPVQVCYAMVLVCFPTTQNNMLHFIQSDSKVSFNFILALRRYRKRFTHLHLHWLHAATLHEICCPGLSSRSEMLLFLFICCAYAWEFFLTIFLEGFADVISTDFLHHWCFALRVFAPPFSTLLAISFHHWGPAPQAQKPLWWIMWSLCKSSCKASLYALTAIPSMSCFKHSVFSWLCAFLVLQRLPSSKLQLDAAKWDEPGLHLLKFTRRQHCQVDIWL